MDLMGGLVVRGIAGKRETYRPIQSQLAADARPSTVAAAFVGAGFREVYIADLDAIGGAEPAWNIYEEVFDHGLDLWVDAGLSSPEHAQRMAQFRAGGRSVPGAKIAAIVAGLESLDGPDALGPICDAVGRDRLVFSLDLKHGLPLTNAPAWQGLSALEIATIALRSGVERMIVLDLAAVGMGEGVGTEPLCRRLRCLAPELQIIAGGGVRGPADLESLARAGCDAALVASALHDGRLPAHETRR